MKKGKDKHIIPEDKSSTCLARATECCGGFHQTIAGALLGSKEWQLWEKEVSRRMGQKEFHKAYDVDECAVIDAMSSEHFDAFIQFIKKQK